MYGIAMYASGGVRKHIGKCRRNVIRYNGRIDNVLPTDTEMYVERASTYHARIKERKGKKRNSRALFCRFRRCDAMSRRG